VFRNEDLTEVQRFSQQAEDIKTLIQACSWKVDDPAHIQVLQNWGII